jgi:hypothetical protein
MYRKSDTELYMAGAARVYVLTRLDTLRDVAGDPTSPQID